MDKLKRERLARLIHDSGRIAVGAGKVLNKPIKKQDFIEFEDLPSDAKEGRYLQADYLFQCRLLIAELLQD